jgi:hypothetical protein
MLEELNLGASAVFVSECVNLSIVILTAEYISSVLIEL